MTLRILAFVELASSSPSRLFNSLSQVSAAMVRTSVNLNVPQRGLIHLI